MNLECDAKIVDLKVIQGDSYILYVTIKKDGEILDHTLISKVYFTCNSLSVQKELTYQSASNKYFLLLTPAETTLYPAGTNTFDITLFFADTSVSTTLYKGVFKVLPKVNPIEEEETENA